VAPVVVVTVPAESVTEQNHVPAAYPGFVVSDRA
jgi:hypothetical protein